MALSKALEKALPGGDKGFEKFSKLSDAQKNQLACGADVLTWILMNKLSLGHGPWTHVGRKYQLDILRCNAPKQCTKKGSQLGFSEMWILKTLHGIIYRRYKKGSLYLFPTTKTMESFSKTRFSPIIDANHCIGGYMSTDINDVYTKRIGNSHLYLRGAKATKTIGGKGGKRSSDALKSIPVDRVVFDEVDEIARDMVQLARKRLGDSEVKEEMYLSTPSVPNYGIDSLYSSSDQKIWMIRCEKCGKYTCLEMEFPECIHINSDGTGTRICRHCRDSKLDPDNGLWEAQFPNRSKDMVGWWISRLCAPRQDPGEIIKDFNDPPNGDLSEVYNSDLGMAYVAAENRLKKQDVFECCNADTVMATSSEGPCCMGFDIGKEIHVLIGEKPSAKRVRIIKIAVVKSENDVYDLAKRFNVKFAVCDKYPETRLARKMQEQMKPVRLYLCGYQEGKKRGGTDWNDNIGEIYGNRTELCDGSHEFVKQAGELSLELCRRDSLVEEYAYQMSNMAKIYEEDEESGLGSYGYRRLDGPDHFRHATNYLMLAATRTGTIKTREFLKRFKVPRQGRSWKTV